MSYFAYDQMGATISSPSESQMQQLLASLTSGDLEHPDVSLTHESGWSISVFSTGLLVFENVESREGPWHMRDVTFSRAQEFWLMLAAGKLKELRSLPWAPGYGT